MWTSSSASRPDADRRNRHILLAIIGAVLLVAVLAVGLYLLRPRPAIPQAVQSRLTFTPYVVRPGGAISVDRQSYKYDPAEQGLSFVATGPKVGRLVVSEQPTPQQFIDIPDVYNKLVDGLNRYSVFDNQLGTVYLTKPKNQPSGQTAVLNSNGVLMFVRSEKDLSDGQWRVAFSSFRLED